MPADNVLKVSPAPAQSDPLDRLTSAVERVASMLESIAGPLQEYLKDNFTTHAVTVQKGPSVEGMLTKTPLAPFLNDDSITDILVNGPYEIYVMRDSRLQKTNAAFADAQSLLALAKAIAASNGRTINPDRPLVDARLRDGSRVNIIAPPMAVGGLNLSIRKFPKQELTLELLTKRGEMTGQIAEFLRLCAQERVSMLISGGTGTGKTTLLNAISHYIPESERIITIEDTAELRLQQPHVVRLETKTPSVIGERKQEVNASDLVRNALRMRPDRIIVGEVRGEEAYDMIQALNTGHDGSMSTVHANATRDAFTRLENLIAPRMQNTPAEHIRHQIVSALNLIVQIAYDTHGTRRIQAITEIVGMEGEIPTMQDIFRTREDEHGNVIQSWSGIIPRHKRLNLAMRENPHFRSALEMPSLREMA